MPEGHFCCSFLASLFLYIHVNGLEQSYVDLKPMAYTALKKLVLISISSVRRIVYSQLIKFCTKKLYIGFIVIVD